MGWPEEELPAELDGLVARYRDGLLDDTLPFWIDHGFDREHGGLFTSLGRGGELLDTDKSIWFQGRFGWLLATLHARVEQRASWLEGAKSCVDFLERHGFGPDGRMRFLVTRDGRPLRTRRYAYSEAFAAMAFAAAGQAAADPAWSSRGTELFEAYVRRAIAPGDIEPKVDPDTRPSRGLGPLMIGVGVAQALRASGALAGAEEHIDRWIDEIERDFCKPELGAVMEVVAPDGGVLDHFDGRLLNPGHAIEAAWFVLEESRVRGGDDRLTELGIRMLDWMWARGWDTEHGGLFSFVDLEGRPVQCIEHQMKYWWPHAEACIATLLAWRLTGDRRFAILHRQVSDWAHEHFADPEGAEWFGYLNRDGSVATELKGGHWKGPFHLPRMQLLCWELLKGAASASPRSVSR